MTAQLRVLKSIPAASSFLIIKKEISDGGSEKTIKINGKVQPGYGDELLRRIGDGDVEAVAELSNAIHVELLGLVSGVFTFTHFAHTEALNSLD